jgi:ribosomal protein S18 acetylase RimI-like enzyme
MLKAEVVRSFDESIVNTIVRIHRDSFPLGWEYENDKKYYGELIKNGNNIIILLNEDGKRFGFLLAIPHNDAVLDLKNYDELMREDAFRYYIETVAILPEYRSKKGFSAMFETLIIELKKRSIQAISLHARVSNNFTKIIQKKLKVTKIRRIDKWKYYKYDEPTDYIEGNLL